ncbi:hypothetical protein A2U01_0076567, partial [Trifolium medium]|nr:hypothetical protein [Trifolium medium]
TWPGRALGLVRLGAPREVRQTSTQHKQDIKDEHKCAKSKNE